VRALLGPLLLLLRLCLLRLSELLLHQLAEQLRLLHLLRLPRRRRLLMLSCD
jgi:hypothetical protein